MAADSSPFVPANQQWQLKLMASLSDYQKMSLVADFADYENGSAVDSPFSLSSVTCVHTSKIKQ